MNIPNLDNLGRFTPAKVNGKRVRLFIGNDGRVGCSPTYSRVEAWRNSQCSVVRTNPRESALVSVMRAKGFPVTNDNDALCDVAANAIAKEFAQ